MATKRPTIPSAISFIESCDSRYFLTLTTKRDLTSEAMSREVSVFFDRMNQKLFGPAYKRHRRIGLATYCVQEKTYADGLHTHALVGIPNGSLRLKAQPPKLSFPDLATAVWVGLDPIGRRPNGQDVQPVYDLLGAANYINKDVHFLAHFDQVDVMNTFLPDLSRCPGLKPG